MWPTQVIWAFCGPFGIFWCFCGLWCSFEFYIELTVSLKYLFSHVSNFVRPTNRKSKFSKNLYLFFLFKVKELLNNLWCKKLFSSQMFSGKTFFSYNVSFIDSSLSFNIFNFNSINNFMNGLIQKTMNFNHSIALKMNFLW